MPISLPSVQLSQSATPAVVAVACGGNQGDVPGTLQDALWEIASDPRVEVVQASRLYQTTPIGSRAGAPYVNGVWLLRTRTAPGEFLGLLHQIEARFGRIRTGHWEPRTLDLDLLHYDDLILQTPHLILPHPACWYRRFVLDPWTEVEPQWKHPQLGETVQELQRRLQDPPLEVIAAGPSNLVVSLTTALLEFTGDGRVRLNSSTRNREPDLILRAGTPVLEPPPSPRSIELPDSREAASLARQILLAALDVPQLLFEPAPAEIPAPAPDAK